MCCSNFRDNCQQNFIRMRLSIYESFLFLKIFISLRFDQLRGLRFVPVKNSENIFYLTYLQPNSQFVQIVNFLQSSEVYTHCDYCSSVLQECSTIHCKYIFGKSKYREIIPKTVDKTIIVNGQLLDSQVRLLCGCLAT